MVTMDAADSLQQATALLLAGKLDEAVAASAPLAATNRGKHALIEGLVAQRRGDRATALSCLGRAVQLDIDDVEALVALATLQLELGHPSFAMIPAERAGRTAPDRPESYAVLAAAQQRLGHMEAALETIRRGAVAKAAASGILCNLPGYREVEAELAKLRAAATLSDKKGPPA
jgi:tetratricopeptide (TPR) repeat protein